MIARPQEAIALFVVLLQASAGLAASAEIPCEPGTSSLISEEIQPDGSYATRAASSVRSCLFHGDVVLDEFRSLDPDGRVTFRGASVDVRDEGRLRTLWVMVGDPGMTIIDGQIRDGSIVREGSGRDGTGAFLERSETSFPSAGTSLFVMDRSYDGGVHWIEPFNRIERTRTPDVPAPAVPAAPVWAREAGAPEVRGPGVWHGAIQRTGPDGAPMISTAVERVSVILDGHALLSEVTETGFDGSDVTRSVIFTARYDNPDRWRSVRWELGERPYTVDELPVRAFAGTSTRSDSGVSRSLTILEASAGHRVEETRIEDRVVERRLFHRRREPAASWKERLDGPISGQGCNGYRFVLGDWSLRAWAVNPDRSKKPGVGYMLGYETMDGKTIAADMHVLFLDGTGFRGTTLRTYVAAEQRWHVYWHAEGASEISGPGSADPVRADLCEEVWTGQDQHGAYVDRLRLIDIDEDSFDVVMPRTYGEGDSRFVIDEIWKYEARRIP